MNKQTFNASLAMSDMDDALISEAVNVKKPKPNRLGWIAAAAAAVLVVGAAIAVPKLIKHNDGDVTALAPEDQIETTSAPANEPDPTKEAYQEPAETEEPEEVEPVTTAEPAALAVTSFDSVGALNMAVRSGTYNEINGAFNGLAGIYMPVKVPYGSELTDITVNEDNVRVTYEITDEYWMMEDGDPNRFVFIWYRNWIPGSAEEFAQSLFYGPEYWPKFDLHCVDGVWIFGASGNIERCAVWEKDGCGFEIITPGAYCEDSDTIDFTRCEWVPLGGVDAYEPAVGFVIGGYLWIEDNGMGCTPVSVLAYSTAYSAPADGGEGVMLRTEGQDLFAMQENLLTYEGRMRNLPQVGPKFRPMLLEDTDIVRIDVYDIKTLELIEEDISLERLHAYAELELDPDMVSHITGASSGSVLVNITIEHRGNYVPALNEYEVDAYCCWFVLDCGY